MFDSTKFPLAGILANTVTMGYLELNSEAILPLQIMAAFHGIFPHIFFFWFLTEEYHMKAFIIIIFSWNKWLKGNFMTMITEHI